MSTVLAVVGDALVAAGLLFVLSGVLGVLRLPDFYTRLHALGKCDTVGVGLMVAGLAFRSSGPDAAKMGVIVVFVLLAGPVASHALARAAWKSGEQPWQAGEPRPGEKGRQA